MSDVDIEIENAKLELEREKLALEDKWKKRIYVWTILSALLTAVVALAVAFVPGRGDSPKSASLAAGPVQNCLDSLKRIESLSNVVGQDVVSLSQAIQVHSGQCEGVLDTLKISNEDEFACCMGRIVCNIRVFQSILCGHRTLHLP